LLLSLDVVGGGGPRNEGQRGFLSDDKKPVFDDR
jgi:hypothetical protein